MPAQFSMYGPRSEVQQSKPAKASVGVSSRCCKNVSPEIAQARLDRASSPPGLYARSYVRWMVKLNRDKEAWPSWELKERLEEACPEVARLDSIRLHPPTGMSGQAWGAIADQHDRLKGQVAAIEETLDGRARAKKRGMPRLGGVISVPTSAPPTTTPAPALDPFELE